MPNNVCAVDIGTNTVKALSLSRQDDGYVIDKLGVAGMPVATVDKSNPLKHRDQFLQTLRKAMRMAKLTGTKNIVFSVSGDYVVIRFLTFTQMPREELTAAAANEAEQYIPFNINDVVIAADIIAPESKADKTKMDIMLTAGKKAVLDQYLQIIEAAGLNPMALDIDVAALSNVFKTVRPFGDSDDITGLLNLGASSSILILFDQDRPVFSRDIGIGGDNITRVLDNDFSCGIDNAELFKKKYARIKSDMIAADPAGPGAHPVKAKPPVMVASPPKPASTRFKPPESGPVTPPPRAVPPIIAPESGPKVPPAKPVIPAGPGAIQVPPVVAAPPVTAAPPPISAAPSSAPSTGSPGSGPALIKKTISVPSGPVPTASVPPAVPVPAVVAKPPVVTPLIPPARGAAAGLASGPAGLAPSTAGSFMKDGKEEKTSRLLASIPAPPTAVTQTEKPTQPTVKPAVPEPALPKPTLSKPPSPEPPPAAVPAGPDAIPPRVSPVAKKTDAAASGFSPKIIPHQKKTPPMIVSKPGSQPAPMPDTVKTAAPVAAPPSVVAPAAGAAVVSAPLPRVVPPPPPASIDGEFNTLLADIKKDDPGVDEVLGRIGRIKKPPSIEGGNEKKLDPANVNEAEIAEDMGVVLMLLLPQVVNDITRSINYFESQNKGRKVTRLFITGGSSNIGGLKEYLAAKNGIPVEKLDLAGHFKPAKGMAPDTYEETIDGLGVALGLGLRILGEK